MHLLFAKLSEVVYRRQVGVADCAGNLVSILEAGCADGRQARSECHVRTPTLPTARRRRTCKPPGAPKNIEHWTELTFIKRVQFLNVWRMYSYCALCKRHIDPRLNQPRESVHYFPWCRRLRQYWTWDLLGNTRRSDSQYYPTCAQKRQYSHLTMHWVYGLWTSRPNTRNCKDIQ